MSIQESRAEEHSSSTTEQPKLDAKLSTELHRLEPWHVSRALVFVAFYLAGSATAMHLISSINSWTSDAWLLVLALPCYVVAAASLHGISLFTHEGVHGVLSKHASWNRALSIACALPVGQNFSAYRVLHLRHHRHLGDEGDPDHYKNYTSWSWLVFSMHWGRLLLGYPAYLVMIPILGFRQGTPSDRVWIVFEVLLFVGLAAAVIASPLSWFTLLHAWLIPMILINTMINIRGMSQHTLLEHETDTVRGTRTILTHPIVRFFMCNENYHLEHHLYPKVPWYHLPAVHAELRDSLRSRGAPFIDSYFEFVRDFVVSSIRRSPIGTVRPDSTKQDLGDDH